MSAPPSYEEFAPPDYDEMMRRKGEAKVEEQKAVNKAKSIKTRDEEFEKWDKRRLIASAVEIGVNAGEKAGQVKEVMDCVQEGAEGVKTVAAMNAEATEVGAGAGDVDVEGFAEVAGEFGKEAGMAYGVEGAEGGVEGMAEAAAANEIVDGHQYHECIEGTCLEEPVRMVTEECAIPLYKWLAETCFSCCCSADANENIENAEQAGEVTGEAAKGAGDSADCAANCFDAGICGWLDAYSWCVFDEALAFALPIIGTCFSCFRLYQGTLLSFNGCLGRWKAAGGERDEKVRFQWMTAEGHARLWQGCCGLIGAAPGLIIITLPLIIACGVVANKAKKNRKLIEGGPEPKTTADGKVVQAQPKPEPFPDAQARKAYFQNAYQIVSGEKVVDGDKETDQELAELGFSDKSNPYPNAPQGRWSTGVFDCLDHVPSCVTAICCTCITAGQVAQAARLFKGVFYATIAAYVIDYVVGCGGILIMIFGTFVIAKSRARIGKVYNIHVDPCENWCLSFWCGSCVVAQVARHLFAWDRQNTGQWSGWLECGSEPMSRWPSMGRAHFTNGYSASNHGAPVARGQYATSFNGGPHIEGAKYGTSHAPSAVTPMERC